MLYVQCRNKSPARHALCLLLRAGTVASALVATTTHADGIPIYGGPAYSSSTSTGYRSLSVNNPQALALGVNNAGTVIGNGIKVIGGVNQGNRGWQWGATQATVTDFQYGDTTDGYRGFALAINDAGSVAGSGLKYTGGVASSVLLQWNAAGEPSELGNLPNDGTFSYSTSLRAMNSDGAIVGTATKFVGGSSTSASAVRWDAGSATATRLGNLGLPETGNTGAMAINAAGTTVGYSANASAGYAQYAVKWEATSPSPIVLSNPTINAIYDQTRAQGINDAGVVIGNTQVRSASNNYLGERAIRWDADGNPTQLGDFGLGYNGGVFGYTSTNANAINAAGSIVGYTTKYVNGGSIGTRAVRWDADSPAAIQLNDLGTDSTNGFEGSTTAFAYDINNAGIAVGQSALYVAGVYQGLRAVAWNADGTAIDLNTLIDPNSGWLLTSASQITDTGWIIGVGTFTPGGADAPYSRTFLLNINAPEPATWALAISGLVALAAWRMRRLTCRNAVVCCLVAGALLVQSAAVARAEITIDTVPIGNAGNANDPATGYGGVAYAYRMGTTEVTVGQYVAFLNAVAATDTHSLYLQTMAPYPNGYGGIVRTGSSGSYVYSVSGSAAKPITSVSWANAARFTNWLHNGQPSGLQDASTTEDGAYTLTGAPVNVAMSTVTRNAGATWFIPNENEWYKAAYHKNDGVTDHYWSYPTSTNSVPYSDQPPGTDAPTPANTANVWSNDGQSNGYNDGYAATGSNAYVPYFDYLTNAAAYASSISPYGTFDQGGNVAEWNESLVDYIYAIYGYDMSNQQGYEDYLQRGTRGGSFFWGPNDLSSVSRDSNSAYVQYIGWDGVTFPAKVFEDTGFRVAAIPEPGSRTLAGMAVLGLFARWFGRVARGRSSRCPAQRGAA